MTDKHPLVGIVMGSDSDWPVMQAAAVILKEFGVPFEARVVSAHRALRMATLDGARALGLDHEIGSLCAGKAADLCAVRIAEPDALPCFHPVSHLVHVLGRHDVSDVWVAGQRRLQAGRLLQITNTELLSTARLWQNRLRQ